MSSSNWDRYKQEINSGMYDIGLVKKHYDVVLDIGANIGYFTQYIHDRAKRIYAVEPSQENYIKLYENIVEWGYDNIDARHIGIGKVAGVRMYDSGHESMIFGPAQKEKIPVMSLQQFLDMNNIKKVDLIKIDCEGCELEIFTDEFHAVKDRVKSIVGEAHAGFDPIILKQYGYEVIGKNGIFFATI